MPGVQLVRCAAEGCPDALPCMRTLEDRVLGAAAGGGDHPPSDGGGCDKSRPRQFRLSCAWFQILYSLCAAACGRISEARETSITQYERHAEISALTS